MGRFILRLILTAVAFRFILPAIPGIDFHGQFTNALWMALVFGVVSWLVDLFALFLASVFTISTFGLALLILIPLWIVGFWILPAIALKLVADMMPLHLAVNGWMAAAFGGLVLMGVNLVTSKWSLKK